MRPGVVVLVGRSGAGTGALAAAVAAHLPGARVLDRDRLRRALFSPGDDSAAERDLTYAAMLDAARYHMGRGRVVVLAGLGPARRREVGAAEAVAEEAGGFSAVVVCDSASGTTVELEEPAAAYLTLDMAGDVDSLAAQALAYVEELSD